MRADQIYHFATRAKRPRHPEKKSAHPTPPARGEMRFGFTILSFCALSVSHFPYSSILAPLCYSHFTITTSPAALLALAFHHHLFIPNTGSTVFLRPLLPAYRFTFFTIFCAPRDFNVLPRLPLLIRNGRTVTPVWGPDMVKMVKWANAAGKWQNGTPIGALK